MSKYNFRKHLERQRKLQGASRGAIGTGTKKWLSALAITALFLLSLGFAIPQSWQYVGLPSLTDVGYRLGLDLQGGTHLVYEADMSNIAFDERGDALEGVRDVIERRVNAFGVSEPVVQTIMTGGAHRVVVDLAGVLDVNDAISQIGETPVLEFKEPGDDSGQLTEEEIARLDEAQAADRSKAQTALDSVRATGSFGEGVATETIEKAVPAHPIYGPLVSAIVNKPVYRGQYFMEDTPEGIVVAHYDSSGTDTQWLLSQILICFEGKKGCGDDAIPAIEANIKAGKALERITPENFNERADEYSYEPSHDLSWIQPGMLPSGLELAVRELGAGKISTNVVESEYGYHIFYKRDEKSLKTYQITKAVFPLTTASDIAPDRGGWTNTSLSGKQLKRAVVAFDQQGTGEPFVSIQFDSEGDKLFGSLTSRLIDRPIGIFLDGQLISAPVVTQAIYGGQAQITGNFTIEEAKLLAQRLNAGALPVPIELMSQQTVGPTLGKVSLDRSMVAGIIGFLLVAAFMILYYRLLGLLSVIALCLYALLNLSAYKIFGVTMTLAGIVGLILSVGMAVDANVLIFERIKEELKAGRDLARASEEGFKRAWTSIRDGNVTTLIATVILFFFSTSFIKGFAVTLSIGVLLSMFSAIVITRTFVRIVIGWKWLSARWLYCVGKKQEEI
jgi:preprotein translocase subunit SecD